jgi:hypothetical protein
MDEIWPKEDIPDQDTLFMRVHVNNTDEQGEPAASAFRDHGGGMSTNWHKYCPTAEEARQKASHPDRNGVVQFMVSAIREIPSLLVEHAPDHVRRDRSHTDVIGEKDEETRFKLRKACHWAIRVARSSTQSATSK